jgi:ABC-type multidrug transport system fused ATPase/permease subunit
VFFISTVVDRHKTPIDPTQSFIVDQQLQTNEDHDYALGALGDASVYQFFLFRSPLGMFIALATILVQIWLLFIFVEASEVNLTSTKSALAYTYSCPRDNKECEDETGLTRVGWLAFWIMFASNFLPDMINGPRMIWLAGKARNIDPNYESLRRFHTTFRYFIGGFFFSTISIFTTYVSFIYNKATATTNTDSKFGCLHVHSCSLSCLNITSLIAVMQLL